MNGELKIHGMWGARADSLDDTVRRVTQSLQRLGDISPIWKVWHRVHHSLADRLRPTVRIDHDERLIRAELLDGRVINDDGTIDEALGYSLRAFAGPEQGTRIEQFEFYTTCCHRTAYSGPNVLLLKLPGTGNLTTLLKPELLSSAIVVLAEIWEPDWLSIWNEATKIIEPRWHAGPILGWITYIAKSIGTVPRLPAGWRWAPSRNERQIFLYEPGLPSPENPDDVLAFKEVLQCIRWERDA